MKKFRVYYIYNNGQHAAEHSVEARSPLDAANWLLKNHPRTTENTIEVCGPCHCDSLTTAVSFRNPLFKAQSSRPSPTSNYHSSHTKSSGENTCRQKPDAPKT